MYKITFIHKNETEEHVLYEPANDNYCLTKAQLTLEVGKSGELKLGIPSANTERNHVVCLTDEVIVYRDEDEIFRGRPVTQQNDFYVTGELTCEGILSYLYDTYYPPFDFSGKPNDLLKDVINNHNSFVESRKQFRVGKVTVSDPNDYIARSSDAYNRTITLLSEKFVGDSLGGYFRARVENGIKYLDYLSSYGTSASQKVELGSNILDISTEVEYGDIITAVLPLGHKTSETDEDGNQISSYVTVETVNNGGIYVRDEILIQKYGFICACVEWQDVTDPGNLLTKAKAYLAQNSISIETITVNAVDLSIADTETQPFKLGYSVQVISKPHGIEQIMELSSMQLDLLDPANDQLTFGETGTSLVGNISSGERNIKESLNNLTMIIGRISSDYITTKNLTAEIAKLGYATIGELDAEMAKLGYVTVSEANIKYAAVGELEALSTRTNLLEADYSELATLVNGNLTSANIQSLTLTAANTTIENGMIKNAMIDSLEFGKITGIDINTTLLTVHSADGKSTWTDNTIQISDANRVRVQIGEDASGDYNMYLWDALGNLLWNATGVTESGLNDGIIKDVAVADGANISGSKLNIASVVQEINDGTTKLKSTTILLDEAGQTLDVAFNTMTTTMGNNLAEAKTYADSVINGLQIGGTNLLPDTNVNSLSAVAGKATRYWSDATRTDITCAFFELTDSPVRGLKYGVRQGCTVTGNYGRNLTWRAAEEVELADGEEYTLSCYARITSGTKARLRFRFYGTGTQMYYIDIENTGWKRVSKTITVNKAAWGAGYQDYCNIGCGGLYATYVATVELCGFKLEKGNKATDWTPAPGDVDAGINNITEITTTQSTQISTMQGQITALITEDTNIKGNYNTLVSRYNSTVAEVDSMKTTIGEHTTLIDANTDDILSVQTKANTLESDLNGTKSTVSAIQSDLTGVESRVSTAESSIEQQAAEIALTVKESDVTGNYLIGKINLSSTTATIAAKHINLAGAVTISMLANDTKTQLNTATSNASTALTNAAAAQSTADEANTAATAAAVTANAAKDWMDASGAPLLGMVKKWTDGAVSDTTQILGGWLKTNTVTADKLAIGDFTNLATVDENDAATATDNNRLTFLSGGGYVRGDGYITKYAATTGNMILSTAKRNTLQAGDKIYFSITGHVDSGGSTNTIRARVMCGDDPAVTDSVSAYANLAMTTSDGTFTGTITVTDAMAVKKYFCVGLNDNRTTKTQVYVKDVMFYRQASAVLIADGAIKAAKIDVEDLFAQNITAKDMTLAEGCNIGGLVIGYTEPDGSTTSEISLLKPSGRGSIMYNICEYDDDYILSPWPAYFLRIHESIGEIQNDYFSVSGDGNLVASSVKTTAGVDLDELNTIVSGKEPTQKRAYAGCYYKNGYDCFLHAANVVATSVVFQLATAYRPRTAAVVSGWCYNKSQGGYYPCVGLVNADGTWSYLSALTSFGAATPYFLYSKADSINRLSNFSVWLTGAWATNTNGA